MLLARKRRRDRVASKQAEAPLLPGTHATSGGGSPGLLGTWHAELEGEPPLLPGVRGIAANGSGSPGLLGTWHAEVKGGEHEEDEDGGCTEERARLEGATAFNGPGAGVGEPSMTGRRAGIGFDSRFRRKR